MSRLLVLLLAATGCEGETNPRVAAELAAGPTSRCVATQHDAMCISGASVYVCRLDGVFFHVAICGLIGTMTAEQPR